MTNSEHSDLPGSFCVSLDSGLERHLGVNGELVLLGGDPLRLLRLNDRSAALVKSLGEGTTLSDTARAANASLHTVAKLCRRLLDAGIAHPTFAHPISAHPISAHPISANTFRSGAVSSTETGQIGRKSGDLGPESSENQPDFNAGVTMVVPVKDRPAQLERLLRSIRGIGPLEAGSTGTRTPLIVVDDGSKDARQTSEIAARYDATVARHEDSRGPAAARNSGAKAATTEFVAFVDSDCEIVDPHWLSTCLAQFSDPNVAAVAPRIVGIERKCRNSLHAYESVRSSLDLGGQAAKVAPMHRVAYVPAAALVVRRNMFIALHGFNETMHVGEDVDFVWRVDASNHTVRYEPVATVAHDHRTTYEQFVKRRFQYATSSAALDQRHPGKVPPLVLSPWSAGVWASVATQTALGLLSALGIAGYSAAKFPAKLTMLREPGPVAARLVARGHLGAGRQLASATWRTYLPIALLISTRSNRARRWTVTAGLVHNVLDYRQRKPPMNLPTYVGIRCLDDAAYCAGLWWGCISHRNVRPLLPKLNNWPGQRKLNQDS
jgi:mycofactocin glycosyltransferase